MIGKATDEELVEAYRVLADSEGVFCEPASAASVAGLFQMDGTGYFEDGSVLTCTLTGHGLKDPDIAIESSKEPETVGNTVEEVLEVSGL
jgi:threonine synthase